MTEKSFNMKLAVTETEAFIVTLHVPVPEQAPSQPAKFEVELGAAVIVTEVPGAKIAAQELPQ
jgi:hypothetical protein